MIDRPNSSTATESTPNMKNFSDPSVLRRSNLRRPAMTNPGIDTISSAMKIMTRSRALGINSMPANADSSRK